jgi:hypothetical protein
MDKSMEIRKHKGNYQVNLYQGKGKRRQKSHYWNIIDRDPNKLAQIFIDLRLEGYPIEKAFKIMQERMGKRDWLGI